MVLLVLPGSRGSGALIGAVAGAMKKTDASTTLMLTDTRSEMQVAAAQGNARIIDFGFGALGIGSGGGGAAGAYNKTPQGKVIAAAFLDSYKLVKAVREYAPHRAAGGLGTGGAFAVDGAPPFASDFPPTDAQRKLADMGLYNSKIDGRSGPGTSAAISRFQKIRGLPSTGELDDSTVAALRV